MNEKKPRSPRVSRAFVKRLQRLLDMEYRPGEIAEELEITTETIYKSYIPAGLPHRREANGRIWINGDAFSAWVHAALEKGARYASQRRTPIGPNQAFCLSCRQVRDFARITRRVPQSAGRIFVHGVCKVCGHKMQAIKKEV